MQQEARTIPVSLTPRWPGGALRGPTHGRSGSRRSQRCDALAGWPRTESLGGSLTLGPMTREVQPDGRRRLRASGTSERRVRVGFARRTGSAAAGIGWAAMPESLEDALRRPGSPPGGFASVLPCAAGGHQQEGGGPSVGRKACPHDHCRATRPGGAPPRGHLCVRRADWPNAVQCGGYHDPSGDGSRPRRVVVHPEGQRSLRERFSVGARTGVATPIQLDGSPPTEPLGIKRDVVTTDDSLASDVQRHSQ